MDRKKRELLKQKEAIELELEGEKEKNRVRRRGTDDRRRASGFTEKRVLFTKEDLAKLDALARMLDYPLSGNALVSYEARSALISNLIENAVREECDNYPSRNLLTLHRIAIHHLQHEIFQTDNMDECFIEHKQLEELCSFFKSTNYKLDRNSIRLLLSVEKLKKSDLNWSLRVIQQLVDEKTVNKVLQQLRGQISKAPEQKTKRTGLIKRKKSH